MNTRWLARAAFALMFAAAAVLIGFAELAGLVMVVIGAIGACLVVAGGYWFLAHRGLVRWIAFAVVILAPVAILVLFALNSLIWVAVVSVALMVLAAGRRPGWRWPRRPPARGCPSARSRRPTRAFLIMNPRSGGGKVAKFGLKEKAEALGAKVALLEGPGRWTWRPWPGRRSPTALTCSGWPGATGHRRWWPGSPPSTISRSW